jgi:hypothetical protein
MKPSRKAAKAHIRITRLGAERDEIVAAIRQAYDLDQFDCDIPEIKTDKRKPRKRRKGD